MDDDLAEGVQDVFIKLYEDKLIYRGKRLVNWDPILLTALSDLEVNQSEEPGEIFHFKYPIENSDEFLVVATTRPETMLGDTAVAVHPDDLKYQKYIGKNIILPISERVIPIIADDYVDQDFGSGCVKITPAHDFNDFEIGKRHDLEVINILTKDAKINTNVKKKYRGMDRFLARKSIVSDMDKLGLLEKIEDYSLSVPRGDRSGAILEPYITDQWYVSTERLAKPAIDIVKSGELIFVPHNWSKTYFEWMENIQDWCISRQLWWGHRIPAWYDEQGNVYVGKSEEDIRKKYKLVDEELWQEDDVLDTWFSSALWTFSTLGWPKKDNLLSRYHPTSVLVTGFDIIFFWVARMIMMTTHFIGEVPFKKILIHGLIKDSEGTKMSKSKGNTLDPLDIIDGINLDNLIEKRTEGLMQPRMKDRIEKQTKKEFPDGIKAYGTDALRLTFCSLASGGRDINFDIKRGEGYRNFCNELWNASRFIDMNINNFGIAEGRSNTAIDSWINYKFNETVIKVNKAFDDYRLDLATKAIYEFIWYEFCDWFIELNKINLNEDIPNKPEIVKSMVDILEKTLRLAHPIMPFITEEIWNQFKQHHGSDESSLMISDYPVQIENVSESDFLTIEWLKEAVTGIRNIRGELSIKPSTKISAIFKGGVSKDKESLEKVSNYMMELSGFKNIFQNPIS